MRQQAGATVQAAEGSEAAEAASQGRGQRARGAVGWWQAFTAWLRVSWEGGTGAERTAEERTQRLVLLALAFIRVGTLSILLFGAFALWLRYGPTGAYHGDLWFAVLVLALVAESTVFVQRCWRAGRVLPKLMTADVAVCAVALVVNGWASGHGAMSSDSFLVFTYSIPVALVIGVVYAGGWAVAAAEALLVLGGFVPAAEGLHPVMATWNVIFNAGTYLAATAIAWVVTRHLWWMAVTLDEARRASVEQTRRRSETEARLESLREIYGSVLQTMEVLAPGGKINDPRTQRLVTAEAIALRLFLENNGPDEVANRLRSVLIRRARKGLPMTVVLYGLAEDGPQRRIGEAAAHALADALGTVLDGVMAASRTDAPSVRATVDGDRLVITVGHHAPGAAGIGDARRALGECGGEVRVVAAKPHEAAGRHDGRQRVGAADDSADGDAGLIRIELSVPIPP